MHIPALQRLRMIERLSHFLHHRSSLTQSRKSLIFHCDARPKRRESPYRTLGGCDRRVGGCDCRSFTGELRDHAVFRAVETSLERGAEGNVRGSHLNVAITMRGTFTTRRQCGFVGVRVIGRGRREGLYVPNGGGGVLGWLDSYSLGSGSTAQPRHCLWESREYHLRGTEGSCFIVAGGCPPSSP